MIEQQQARSRGFTLVEMSVVLIIVAAVTAMALSSGVAVLSTARFSATTQKMAVIDQALMAYRNVNNRLPCPGSFSILAGATNYGVEAGGGMSCGTGSGVGSGVCTGNLPYAVGTCTSGTALVPAASYSAAGVTNTGNTGAEGSVLSDPWEKHVSEKVERRGIIRRWNTCCSATPRLPPQNRIRQYPTTQ
jgi:prepilin-type N-terminal cleavage/methylation domain-containing protein